MLWALGTEEELWGTESPRLAWCLSTGPRLSPGLS